MAFSTALILVVGSAFGASSPWQTFLAQTPVTAGAPAPLDLKALDASHLKDLTPSLDLNFKLPAEIKLDLQKVKSIRSYMENGGDISGGGFGLMVKGSDRIVLHDLWCENHLVKPKNDLPRANALVPTDLSAEQMLRGWPIDLDQQARAEKTLALARLQAWRPMAPELIDQIRMGLEARGIWYASLFAPADNPIDQFEFPGTERELELFHRQYTEIQVGRVERFTGRVYLTSGLWDRMDLRSRAGLLIHESLRRVYLRSIAGYLRPSILQWMTGAMMFRDPSASEDDRRMFESFYEELFANLEGNSELENHRPPKWRGQLCEEREALAALLERIVNASDRFGSLGAIEARETICRLHEHAVSQDRRAQAWIPMVSFRELPACEGDRLPSRLRVYWFQKALGLTWNWTATTGGEEKVFPHDLLALLRSEPNFLSREAYLDLIREFRDIGDAYCPERQDRFGAGAEFSGLGDVLLETAAHFQEFETGDAFIASFKDPRRNPDLINARYRARVLELYRAWRASSEARK